MCPFAPKGSVGRCGWEGGWPLAIERRGRAREAGGAEEVMEVLARILRALWGLAGSVRSVVEGAVLIARKHANNPKRF